MKPNEPKTHDVSAVVTPQEHHTHAAEHFEQAAQSHKEAAKLIEANDQAATLARLKVAQEHATKAQEHVTEVSKKTAPIAAK